MNWHRWFAWHPVTLRNGHFVWLRFVERKWDTGDATGEPRGATGDDPPSTSDRADHTQTRWPYGSRQVYSLK